ncbi:MAG TPA: AarF/UbiB family protein [Verrucomicrobiae bacterium]|nr:AarF/UbiB family protein [Verrucomicrobiae bacterium]
MSSLLGSGLRMTPERVVAFLRKMGPTAIKIGQHLALRPDLLPREYTDAFLALVDRVPPFPWAEAEAVIREELGQSPADLFAYIERRPVAAGSLAQVHRAKLEDGTEVAIKIQRPGIEAAVAKDVRRIRRIARFLEARGGSFVASPSELADEIESWLKQELDFRQELENVERMRSLAASSRTQRIPQVFRRLSTRRVLAYEFLHGVPVSAVLQEIRERPAGSRTLLRQVDPPAFAKNLVRACFTQIFRYQFFHADLHPGNLFILPNNAVGYVDFGLCDELDERVRANQLRYFAAAYDRDLPRMQKALTEILVSTEASDLEGFRRDFTAETRSLEGRSLAPGEAASSPSAQYLSGLARAARRNGFQIPSRILSIYRALVTAETLAAQLGYEDSLRLVGQEFFLELQRDELWSNLFTRDSIMRFLASVLNLARDSPQQINQILTDVADGTLTLRVEVSEAPPVVRAKNQRARLWTLAIVSVSGAVLLTAPKLPALFGISLRWPLAVAMLVLYLWTAYLWRTLK